MKQALNFDVSAYMKRILNFDVFVYSSYIKSLYLIVQLLIIVFVYQQVTAVPVEVQIQQSVVADLEEDAARLPSLYAVNSGFPEYRAKLVNAQKKLAKIEKETLSPVEDKILSFISLFLLYSLLWRFFCEFTIVIFKLHENLDSIAVKLAAKAEPTDDVAVE